MRQASLAFRDVKIRHFTICSRFRLQTPALATRALGLPALRYGPNEKPPIARWNSTAPAATLDSATADWASELFDRQPGQLKSPEIQSAPLGRIPERTIWVRPPRHPQNGFPLTKVVARDEPERLRIQKAERGRRRRGHLTTLTRFSATSINQRWRSMLMDPFRLAFQSDMKRTFRGSWRNRLLVDHPRHSADMEMWCVLLDYQQRVYGDKGSLHIWDNVYARKSLHAVRGTMAESFWGTLLGAVLRSGDDRALHSVFIYAEWLFKTRGVRWPRLHLTIVTHLLQTSQHQQALRWHLILAPSFLPSASEIAHLVQQFFADSDPGVHSVLRALCFTSMDQPLYDVIVTPLYNQGHSVEAVKWRNFLTRHGQGPHRVAQARPFLWYLRGYFPDYELHPLETAALSRQEGESERELPVTRELVNRAQGEVFGIGTKNYNDALGARWFASRWINTQTALATVAALGIEEIGPLSFQSIALREDTSQGVLDCFRQLRTYGLAVADSNYVRLLKSFAEKGDDELLFSLLRSDFHPEVWDDAQLQQDLLLSTAVSNDWRAHRLLLMAKTDRAESSAQEAANTLLEASLLLRNWSSVNQILDDMRTMRVGLDYHRAELLFAMLDKLVRIVSFEEDSYGHTQFFAGVCRRLAAMEIPVPVACWTQLLQSFGRQGKIDELEELSRHIVEVFTSLSSSRPGFVPIHPDDAPGPMKEHLAEVRNLMGIYIPADALPFKDDHPLRLIFKPQMIKKMIRWSFNTMLDGPKTSVPLLQGFDSLKSWAPVDFHYWRAVRLLRLLRDSGAVIKTNEVNEAVLSCLARLYGQANRFDPRLLRDRRDKNTFSLAMMMELADDAWGEKLLPPIDEVLKYIKDRTNYYLQINKRRQAQEKRALAHEGAFKYAQEWADMEMESQTTEPKPRVVSF